MSKNKDKEIEKLKAEIDELKDEKLDMHRDYDNLMSEYKDVCSELREMKIYRNLYANSERDRAKLSAEYKKIYDILPIDNDEDIYWDSLDIPDKVVFAVDKLRDKLDKIDALKAMSKGGIGLAIKLLFKD